MTAYYPHVGEKRPVQPWRQRGEIAAARRDGVDIAAPPPADTAFPALKRDCVLVVAAQHDQGHGRVKAPCLDDPHNPNGSTQ